MNTSSESELSAYQMKGKKERPKCDIHRPNYAIAEPSKKLMTKKTLWQSGPH
jgi:hypothetical protein